MSVGASPQGSDLSADLALREVEGREADWQRFVERAPGASFYHELPWREVVQGSFGHRSHYLMACEAGQVRGVLPLVELRSWLFGHFLVSLPFCTYGGIVAEGAQVACALAEGAVRLARRTGARHIELRQRESAELGWTVRQHKVALVVALPAEPDAHWQGLSSRLRGKVRKAGRAGAQFSVAGAEALPQFYAVFARNMRDLGTPVYPRGFFERVFRHFPDRAQAFLVRLGERPVAAAIGLRRGEILELPWICSDYSYAGSYLNEFLYWSVIEWGCRSGLRWLDLGRSTIGSGPYQFKMQWNPEERPLAWHYWTAPGVALPRLSPENPKYALAIRCWRKLPLAVANRLGPRIVRNIP